MPELYEASFTEVPSQHWVFHAMVRWDNGGYEVYENSRDAVRASVVAYGGRHKSLKRRGHVFLVLWSSEPEGTPAMVIPVFEKQK